jgi:hypothetical protein
MVAIERLIYNSLMASVNKRKKTRQMLVDKLRKEKQESFKRFPLVFTLLAAFGAVITFNGIHGLIQQVEWLNNNPLITFAVGLLILLFTGTLYKKL